MNPEIHQIKVLLDELELSQKRASYAIFQETGYPIGQGTISRVLSGEASGSMVAFVRYSLEQIKRTQSHPHDVDPSYQGCQTYSPDSETEYRTHFIKAQSENEAIGKLVSLGFNMSPTRNETDYGGTEQWHQSAPVVEFLKARNCYAVTICLTLNV